MLPAIHATAEKLTLGLDVSDPIKVHAALLLGLPFSAVTKFEKATQMPRGEVARLISMAPRTLARRQDEKRLQADESDRLFRLATLFRKAIDLFHGDDEAAMRWLRSPRPALGGAPRCASARARRPGTGCLDCARRASDSRRPVLR